MLSELIYRNIKAWIYEYGIDILDLLLVKNPQHKDSLDPMLRYENYEQEFKMHFNSTFHFSEKIMANLPNLSVKISEVEQNSCYAQYDITFKVTLDDTAPIIDNQGDQRKINMGFSEEMIFRYKDNMTKYLICMLESKELDENGKYYTRTMASDMNLLPDWEYPIRTKLYRTQCNDFKVYGEMLIFEVFARIGVEKLDCDFKEFEECEER